MDKKIDNKKRVAIVGTQGVPARYGGFETLVENIIGENSSENIQYTIFCSARDYNTRQKEYKGAKLKYIPFFHANGIQSTPYDIVSLCCCLRGYDTVVLLGVSGCMFLPIFKLLFCGRLIVNIDGLEHRRGKWGKFARRFLLASEVAAVRYADVIVTDNQGIKNYVSETYYKDSQLIAYGGDHAVKHLSDKTTSAVLEKYGLQSGEYAISVCRIEPENNSHIILQAASQAHLPLVFIGNWQRSDYSRSLYNKYATADNITLLDSVYDLEVLSVLRSQARCYIHGHSAGGTNPSLVEAMFFGRPIICFDVSYNRFTTADKARYFTNVDDLTVCLKSDLTDSEGRQLQAMAQQRYTWKQIAADYESIY